jgi:predicted ATP-dependent protease
MNNSKNKGVLIPSLNKEDIILKREVEEAIDKGDFHIYTMDTLEDAIEIMMLDGTKSMEDFYKIINEEILKYATKIKLG